MMYYFVLVVFVCIQASSAIGEKELLKHLLNDANEHVRPVKDVRNPIVVTFGFSLIQIIDLVETDQYMSVKLWLRMSWINEIMTWDPKDWGNVTHTRVNPTDIWTPDIFLKEDVADTVSSGTGLYRIPILIYSGGFNLWMIPVKIESTCLVDVTNFPFDQQVCKLVFVSWTHDQSEMDIKIEQKPVVGSNYVNSSEWKLVDVGKEIVPVRYPCCKYPYVDIEFTFKLERKPLYYIQHVVVPCIIQMLIILFTFFLPPDSGERIGVVITVLLVFAVYLQILSNTLPKNSNSTPMLSHFYITVMIESACSLIVTCFVLKFHFKCAEKNVEAMPSWAKAFFVDCCGKRLGLCKTSRKSSNENVQTISNKGVVYQGEIVNGSSNAGNIDNGKGIELANRQGNSSQLLDEVRVVTSLIHDMNREDEFVEDWQVLAKVLDCMSFVAFFIIYLVSSLVILIPTYLQHHVH